MTRLTTTFNARPLRRVREQIVSGRSAIMKQAFEDVGTLYLSFAKKRFIDQSRGAGEWPALKPATVARRGGGAKGRKRRKGRTAEAIVDQAQTGGSAAILRDTGTLLAALSPGVQGNRLDASALAVDVGFKGGIAKKRVTRTIKGKGGRKRKITIVEDVGNATLEQIAAFHNIGAYPNPKRVILAKPDTATKQRMTKRLLKGVNDIMKAEAR